MFDQRIGFGVKVATYIPDVQIRPHPCGFHCAQFIVFESAVNVNSLVLHDDVRARSPLAVFR
jgi:hypothetical protein